MPQDGSWSLLHLRTKASLLERGLVIEDESSATLTDAALAEIVKYDRAVEDNTLAEQEPKKDKPKRIYLTEQQIRAFEISAKQPYKWDMVSTRTTNFMVNNGWVVVRDDLPRLTDEGRRVYDTHQAQSVLAEAA